MEVDARDHWERLRDLERESRRIRAQMLDELAALIDQWPVDLVVPELECDIARHLGWSRYATGEEMALAEALRELPHLRRASHEGRLSASQLRWVAKFATPQTDEGWARRAPSMTPNQLKLEHERQCRARRQEAESSHAARYLATAWDERRTTFHLEGSLGADQGAAVEAALVGAARAIAPDPGAQDPRAARMADAMVALVTSSRDGPAKHTVVVHTDVKTLTGTVDGTRGLAETAWGVQLQAQTLRRMACMARVRAAVERDGSLIGLVSASRGPTEGQMEALWFRDRHCVFPGCEAKRFVEAHHITHWADGGPTTLENLCLLCTRHHRMLHEGGWTIRGRPPDDLEFVDRWGRVRTRRVPVPPEPPPRRPVPVPAGVGERPTPGEARQDGRVRENCRSSDANKGEAPGPSGSIRARGRGLSTRSVRALRGLGAR